MARKNPKTPKTRAVFVAMPLDLVARLDARRQKEHRSRSQMACLLLAEVLPAEPSKTTGAA